LFEKLAPAATPFTSAEPLKFHPTNGVKVQSADAVSRIRDYRHGDDRFQ